MRSIALAVSLSALIGGPAWAQSTGKPPPSEAVTPEPPRQIYGYVDLAGAWHFVDSLALVPLPYRGQAKANAVDVQVLEADTTARRSPPITRRVIDQGEDGRERAKEDPQRERRDRIAALRTRRTELLTEIAVLEEGSAPESYLDAIGGEALTEARLLGLLDQTEAELRRVDLELATLSVRESDEP